MKKAYFFTLLVFSLVLIFLFNERGVWRSYIYCPDYSARCFVGVYEGGNNSRIYQGGLLSAYFKKPIFDTVEFTEVAYEWLSNSHVVFYINGANNLQRTVDVNGKAVIVDIKWIAGDPCETAFKSGFGVTAKMRCAKGERLSIFE